MTTRPPDGPAFDPRLVAPLVAGAVLNPVNSTIVSVALVPIGVAFGEPPSATAWLISSLYLATAVGQPVVGRLVDVHGARRLFLPATVLVGLAGVLGMLAPDLAVLVVARVVLGFGTCAGYPAAMRLLRDEAARTGQDSPARVLTILAVSTQTVSIIGPPFGGLLIGLGGWRATLAVNLPLAAVAFVLGRRRLPRDAPPRAGRVGLDLPGVALFALMLTALLLFLMHPRPATSALLALAAAAGVGLGVRELRVRDPFLDVRVLGGNRPLLLTYARSLLAYIVSYSFIYGFTQWLEDGRGLSAGAAGVLTLPMFVTGIAVSVTTGRRQELRAKLVVAAVGQLAAVTLLLCLHGDSPVWLLLAVGLVFGVPQGLNGLALQNAVYRQADAASVGTSAGLLRTFGYLGAITSSAAQGGFFGRHADTAGLHALAGFLLVVGAAFLVLNLVDRSLSRVPSAAPADTTETTGTTQEEHVR